MITEKELNELADLCFKTPSRRGWATKEKDSNTYSMDIAANFGISHLEMPDSEQDTDFIMLGLGEFPRDAFSEGKKKRTVKDYINLLEDVVLFSNHSHPEGLYEYALEGVPAYLAQAAIQSMNLMKSLGKDISLPEETVDLYKDENITLFLAGLSYEALSLIPAKDEDSPTILNRIIVRLVCWFNARGLCFETIVRIVLAWHFREHQLWEEENEKTKNPNLRSVK